jgi:hypothetical protein
MRISLRGSSELELCVDDVDVAERLPPQQLAAGRL